jgi:uncharacterized protein YuzE
MKVPMTVEIDLQARAGYVRYGNSEEVVARTERLGELVTIDFDAIGVVFGIEILSFDAETLAKAQAFAQQNGLAFPRDLSGSLCN